MKLRGTNIRIHKKRAENDRARNVRLSVLLRLTVAAVVCAGCGIAYLLLPTAGSGVSAQATLTVSINDAPPVVEGNPTPTPSPTPPPPPHSSPTPTPSPAATFTISLSAPNPDTNPVSVGFSTQDGTAQAGSDYVSTSGTATFAQGEQTKTISVPIISDTQPEGDENFTVNLSNTDCSVHTADVTVNLSCGVTIADGEGTGTIIEDDPGGILRFSSSTFNVNEGDGTAIITVTRTGSLIGTVTVNYSTQFTGSATPAADYGNTAGTLTFAPGDTSETFEVPILEDTLAEGTESLFLNLFGATNGAQVGSPSQATLLIADNDISTNVFAVTATNKLLRFSAAAPDTVTLVGAITGLQPSEEVVGIDVRPATGQLYAIGKTGGVGRLYIIDPGTAAATLVATLTAAPADTTSPYTALNGTAFGVDFNPVPDRLRVVSDADQNLRINPANGQVITDTVLSYQENDSNFGANPNVIASAYTNNFAGSTVTILYGIDSNLDIFIRQEPPNNGILRTISGLPANTTEVTGFDFRASDNAGFASLTAPGGPASDLYLIDFSQEFNVRSNLIGTIGGGEVIRDIALAPAGTFQLSASTTTLSENAGKTTFTITRTGDTTVSSSIDFVTNDGTATQKGDYTIERRVLTFGPGETTKTVDLLIIDDANDEADEVLTVSLTNPTANFTPGTANLLTVTITDNDDGTGANPIDATGFFVRQQYLDFLGREPDAAGFAFWMNQIESCGSDPVCRDIRRVNVSAAFFLSPEFQETGFYVLRIQRAAFRRKSSSADDADSGGRVRYIDFIRDARQVGEGVIIGQAGAEARLEQNKNDYALRIVSSLERMFTFLSSLSAESYVDFLAGRSSVFNLTSTERQNAINAFGAGGRAGRVAALRAFVDSNTFRQAEFNPAFVLLEYFGYLRRNPTDAPDTDNSGYQFWLNKLNDAGGNFVDADMVKSFITSGEYRGRSKVE